MMPNINCILSLRCTECRALFFITISFRPSIGLGFYSCKRIWPYIIRQTHRCDDIHGFSIRLYCMRFLSLYSVLFSIFICACFWPWGTKCVTMCVLIHLILSQIWPRFHLRCMHQLTFRQIPFGMLNMRKSAHATMEYDLRIVMP